MWHFVQIVIWIICLKLCLYLATFTPISFFLSLNTSCTVLAGQLTSQSKSNVKLKQIDLERPLLLY